MITVRYFAAAAEAAGTPAEELPAGTVGDLRAEMAARHGAGLARVLDRCSFLADGVRSQDGTVVADGTTLDVLPPFAGG
jgi:sulfur-carrier protein